LGVLISFFRHEPTEESLEYARQMLEEAEIELREIKEEEEKSDKRSIEDI
jgi:hypothetical protein